MPRFTLLVPKLRDESTTAPFFELIAGLRERSRIIREALWFLVGSSLFILSNGFSREEHAALLRDLPEGSRLISVIDRAPYIAYLTMLHILNRGGEAFYFEEGEEGDYCVALLKPRDAAYFAASYPAALRELVEVAMYLRSHNAVPAIFNDTVVSVIPCEQLGALEKLKEDFAVTIKKAYRSAGLAQLYP